MILLAAIAPLFLIGLYKGPLCGDESEYSTVEFLIVLACCVLPFVMLKLMYLETKLDQHGIHIRFFPLVRKTWEWSELVRAEMVNYGFVGGWGIRLWTQYGTVYNIRGNEGLAFELQNGKKYLVGTQKKDELANFMKDIEQKLPFS